jgi:pentatricopeptide repeat protein
VLWGGGPTPLAASIFHLLIPGLCSKGAVGKARFMFDGMLTSGLAPPVCVDKSLVTCVSYCKEMLMIKRGMYFDHSSLDGMLELGTAHSARRGGWNCVGCI